MLWMIAARITPRRNPPFESLVVDDDILAQPFDKLHQRENPTAPA
jgi:hypothetical protein